MRVGVGECAGVKELMVRNAEGVAVSAIFRSKICKAEPSRGRHGGRSKD